MPNIETSKPSLYGEIDQAVIYTLREEALKMRPPQFYERWTTEKRSSKKGLKRHKALGPLLEMVLDCATQSGYSPRAIDFDIDAHDVKQDSAQRMTDFSGLV
jgi:Mg-chelatase subunit ChlI